MTSVKLNKPKAGSKFVESFVEILKQFAERGIIEDPSMKVSAIFPHLVLPCVKLINNASVSFHLFIRNFSKHSEPGSQNCYSPGNRIII